MANSVTNFGASGFERIGEGAPSGTSFGIQASDKISFYGSTPVIQQTGIGATSDTTVPATTGAYGFTSTQANQILSVVNGLRTLGLLGA
jgi:hypothetical protein